MQNFQTFTTTTGGPMRAGGMQPMAAWDNQRDPRSDFHSWWYLRHTFRVMEHLASLNLPLNNKRILEISAGIGDLTTFFMDRGCTIDATDSRPENLAMLKWRFEKEMEKLRFFFLDLEHPATSNLPRTERYDIVFNFGVLYHLANPKESLEYLAPFAKEMFLLETCVSMGSEEAINLVKEEKAHFSQAMHGTGCRPTRPWIYNQMKRHFPHVYMPKTQPNWKNFITDWEAKESGTPLTRSIFIGSHKPLDNPLLVEGIPMQQTKH